MTGGERVEDTRTLKPGDPVRVVIESVVRDVSPTAFGVSLDADSQSPWWFVGHDERSNVQVYRVPRPLPPEPPVGVEVLDRDGTVWRRQDDDAANPLLRWRTTPDDWAWYTWSTLLSERGPVRLLGDPIEAPR